MTHGLSPRVSEVHSQDMILPKNRRYCKEKLINVCVPFWEKLKSPREHKRKTEKV